MMNMEKNDALDDKKL